MLMESTPLPLDSFEESLIQDVDFILEGKEKIDKKVINKTFTLLQFKILQYSHQSNTFNDNKFFRGYVGHKIRKDFRKDLYNFVSEYLKERGKTKWKRE